MVSGIGTSSSKAEATQTAAPSTRARSRSGRSPIIAPTFGGPLFDSDCSTMTRQICTSIADQLCSARQFVAHRVASRALLVTSELRERSGILHHGLERLSAAGRRGEGQEALSRQPRDGKAHELTQDQRRTRRGSSSQRAWASVQSAEHQGDVGRVMRDGRICTRWPRRIEKARTEVEDHPGQWRCCPRMACCAAHA